MMMGCLSVCIPNSIDYSYLLQSAMTYSGTVSKTRDYYNSRNMMNFHSFIYGEHIHIGLYSENNESIPEANLRTLEKITSLLKLSNASRVLDIGSGYGGTARYLVQTFNCRVDCLNLSEEQNNLNRELTAKQGLQSMIQVIDGSFEAIPTSDDRYDIVWSQDALLYSSDRTKVFQEVFRVLKQGGQFIFTDVMHSDNCPTDISQTVLDNIDLTSLASMKTYQDLAKKNGFEEIQILAMPDQVTNQYRKTLEVLETNYEELAKICDRDFLDYQKVRLANWVTIGNKGYMNWGILHFQKC